MRGKETAQREDDSWIHPICRNIEYVFFSIRLSVHMRRACAQCTRWSEIPFFLLVLSARRELVPYFRRPRQKSVRRNETAGRTNTLRHTRGHEGKKTASVTSAVHRTESGTFFVIKRSEIPEKASSRIKRTADIKAQSKIRRSRKKKSRMSEASVIICTANGRLMAEVADILRKRMPTSIRSLRKAIKFVVHVRLTISSLHNLIILRQLIIQFVRTRKSY